MQFKQKNKSGKALTKAFSVILTISILAVLLISGPASAVTIDLEETSENDGVHKYTAEVSINTDDHIPVDLVAIKLKDSEDTYKCYFDIDDLDLEEDLSDDEDICDMITITDVDEDIEYEETYGYSYGYGYTGETSTNGEVTIKFKIDTRKAPKSNEEFTLRAGIAGLEDDEIEFEYYSDDKLKFTTEKSTETETKTTQYQKYITTKQNSRITLLYGSGEELGKTYSKVFSVGDKTYFMSENDVHSITLTGLKNPIAEITVANQKAFLAVGGQMMFDADNNGKQDILIKLDHIANNKALITITELSDQEKQENQITGMTTGTGNSNPLKAGIATLTITIILLSYIALRKKH